MPTPETFADVELATRDWLRSLSAVTALVDSARINAGGVVGDATEAQVVVMQLDAYDDASEAPIDQALLQLDVYAPTRTDARAIANAIRGALKVIRTPTAFGTEATAYGGQLAGMVWAPDPETDVPRYVMTIELTIRST